MGKKILNVSALQMQSVIGDRNANYEKVKKIVEKELPKDTDLLVLPEVWTVGWSCKDFSEFAENLNNSETVRFLSELAKDYKVNILGGSFIQKVEGDKCLNSCPVINRQGELIAVYSKNHLYSYCGCTEGKYIKVGNSPVMVNIEGVNAGLTICYDIRFPEIFRAYRLAGADLLVNMAAWGLKKPIPWEYLTGARAVENQCYMIAVTQSGKIKDDDYNIGHSRIYDYCGETIAEIKDQREGLMSCSIDFSSMYNYRKICTILKDIKNDYEVKLV